MYYLAKTHGLPYSTVQHWCKDEIEAKSRREKNNTSVIAPMEEVEILRLYETELLSVEAIAERRDLPRSRVNRVIHTHLSEAQRLSVQNARTEQQRQLRISMIRRWVNGKGTFRSFERDWGVSRGTMSGWVRRPDLPADLRAKVAEKLPGNRRRAMARGSSSTKQPEPLVAPTTDPIQPGEELSAHDVQAVLADLGLAAGYEVWVPANDKKRVQQRMTRSDLSDVWPAKHLPERLDAIVRNIDVTWLHDGVVTHCYEVEHSTSVTTGIARIRDAQEQFPNFYVRGYIVGEAAKKRKYDHEVARPSMGASARWTDLRPISFIDQGYLRKIRERAGSEWILPQNAQEWLDQHAVS
ncbi:MAG: hypothetical protein KAG72_13515 [Abyssibacter sp.]|nr:hypothetical protein [Abyssibacter sp.]